MPQAASAATLQGPCPLRVVPLAGIVSALKLRLGPFPVGPFPADNYPATHFPALRYGEAPRC